MGMRPKEILQHVADLSWADLQERDNLVARLRQQRKSETSLRAGECIVAGVEAATSQ